VVAGTTTLRERVRAATLVLAARIVDPTEVVTLDEPARREPAVRVDVLAVLKGKLEERSLRFVQHGHGVPTYARGEKVLVFLEPIEASRELAGSALVQALRWVSHQEGEAKFVLDGAAGAALEDAVGAYVAVERIADPEARLRALRRLTIESLAAGHPAVASSALRDLMSAAGPPLVTVNDLPALERLIAAPNVPIGIRAPLLAELERRRLLDGGPHWTGLFRGTSGEDILVVVRAAVSSPNATVTDELARLAAGDDPAAAAAAAIAIGERGDASAVDRLAGLLEHPAREVRLAAVRGLGRLRTEAARRVLDQAARSHPDPDTRRHAAAQLRR
jgi:hypothetical protein